MRPAAGKQTWNLAKEKVGWVWIVRPGGEIRLCLRENTYHAVGINRAIQYWYANVWGILRWLGHKYSSRVIIRI
jgi:hypothetical protein